MTDREMTLEEIESHLNETHLAFLATVRKDGSPHVAPVWYEHKEGKVFIITNDTAAKVYNIRRDPRVSVSIATSGEPYCYALFQGEAQITTGNLEAVLTSICVRYKGEEEGKAFSEELLGYGNAVVIEITPSRVISWTMGP